MLGILLVILYILIIPYIVFAIWIILGAFSYIYDSILDFGNPEYYCSNCGKVLKDKTVKCPRCKSEFGKTKIKDAKKRSWKN